MHLFYRLPCLWTDSKAIRSFSLTRESPRPRPPLGFHKLWPRTCCGMSKEIRHGSVHIEFHNEVMMPGSPCAPKFLFQARIKEFTIPPITDGLVIGKDDKIGPE